jgi:hypothetical protein
MHLKDNSGYLTPHQYKDIYQSSKTWMVSHRQAHMRVLSQCHSYRQLALLLVSGPVIEFGGSWRLSNHPSP